MDLFMKKVLLRVFRNLNYPFYQAAAGEEEFLDEEYGVIWEETEDLGIKFTVQDRIEIFRTMESVFYLHHEGIEYFYCRNYDEYWEELISILDSNDR